MAENRIQAARSALQQAIESARSGVVDTEALVRQLEAAAAALSDGMHAGQENAGSDALAEHARFISVAIHELRTPMTSIRGYSDMLGSGSMGPLNDMQKQFLETIRTNAKRMESLLTDVSDMNKIRAGTLKLNAKMDTFKNIALMVENAMRPVAEQLGRTLTFEIPTGLPLLELDGELLAKALGKLVENGLRYSPAEGGSVTVRASGAGDRLHLEITDNGIGMTPEELRQLGTLYFRADHDVVRAYKGSGLGIPVAYGIIDRLGGTVSATSEPGAGTTFVVELPGIG